MKLPTNITLLLLASASMAKAAAPTTRPRITGLSHIALYVHDIAKSRTFYRDFLGFDEPYSLPNKDGTLHLTWIKINDLQTIELFPEKEANSDRLYHIALLTDDAVGMRDYLASRGVAVPEKVGKGKIGNLNYFITDPDGHIVEIVQYAPDGWTAANAGKFLPPTRTSDHMFHLGILCGDLAASQYFYGDILGCTETWRGTKNPSQLSWVHERLPESNDFIELMLYSELPDPDKRGRYHHFCLVVPDLDKTKAILAKRVSKVGYEKPLEIQIGVNRKRQMNVYDPDGTRVEFMEPNTIDGKPAPLSTAPVPHPATTRSAAK